MISPRPYISPLRPGGESFQSILPFHYCTAVVIILTTTHNMPHTNYTVATHFQLTCHGERQLRWENQRLERLRTTDNEMPQAGDETIASRHNSLAENLFRRGSERSDKIEIYFSPVSMTGQHFQLSDPLPTPELTSAQYNDVEAAWAAATTNAPPPNTLPLRNANIKWSLRAENLDRLVVALASAPMIQSHVQGETWDPTRTRIPDRPSFMSLRSTLRDLNARDSAVALPSVTGSAGILSPGRPIDLTRSPQAHFAGLAIMEPKARAAELSFWSQRFVRKGQILHNGKSRYLNIPFDSTSTTDCRLRVQTGALWSGKPSITVFLQLTASVLVRKTGKKIYSIVTEIDVTESFRKAAFTELVEQAGYDLDNVALDMTEGVVRHGSNGSIDWCAVADEPGPVDDITDIVNVAVEMITNLEPETCAMQTLTLMSELARTKRKYQGFVFVQCHEHHENGVPSRMSVPWISDHLNATSGKDRTILSDDMSTFRFHMIDITAKRSIQPEPFTVKVPLAGEQKSVHFVPVLNSASEKNTGWGCFLRDISDVGL